MKGQILDVTVQISEGIISADDGNRYVFAFSEWRELDFPQRAMRVDFDVNADGKAVAVYKELPVAHAPVVSLEKDNLASAMNVNREYAAPAPAIAARETAVYQATYPQGVYQNVAPNTAADLSLWDYFVAGLTKKRSDFSGRARRKEFWGFSLFYFILIGLPLTLVSNFLGFIIDRVDEVSGGMVAIAILFMVFAIYMSIPAWAVAARRLHDTGRSGWWQLLVFIPIVNFFAWIVLLIFYCQDSQAGDNQYGRNPKA